MLKVKEVYSSS